MDAATCPACGSTDRREESEPVALLGLQDGLIEFADESTRAVVCRAVICNACGFVALYESK